MLRAALHDQQLLGLHKVGHGALQVYKVSAALPSLVHAPYNSAPLCEPGRSLQSAHVQNRHAQSGMALLAASQ